MKFKKGIAIALTAAVMVGGVSVLAACSHDDDDKKGFKEDTNIWYAVGKDKKGTLANDEDGWLPGHIRDAAKFVRQESTTENVFKLTLDIYSGDIGSGFSFKFLYKTSADEQVADGDLWARQIGIENIVGAEGEGKDCVFKMNGVTVFTTGDGPDAHNIALAKGQEGTYTFTMKTYPGDSEKQPEITVTKDKAIEVPFDMYIHYNGNDFGAGDMGLYGMTEVISADKTTWTKQIEIGDDDLEYKADGTRAGAGETGTHAAILLYNGVDKKTYHLKEAGDYTQVDLQLNNYDGDSSVANLFPKGTYNFKFDTATKEVTVIGGTHEMYFRGSNMSWGTTLGEDDEAYKLNESPDGSFWYGFIAVPEGATHEVKLYNGLKGEWFGGGENGEDNFALTAGIYYFKFTVETQQIEYTKYDEGVKIASVGTFIDDTGAKKHFEYVEGLTPVFTATEVSSVVSTTLTVKDVRPLNSDYTAGFGSWDANNPDAANALMVWKPVFLNADGTVDWNTNGADNNYVTVPAGTYTVTFNLNTHVLTYTPVAA